MTLPFLTNSIQTHVQLFQHPSVAGKHYSFGSSARSSVLAWLADGSGLTDVEIAKHMRRSLL